MFSSLGQSQCRARLEFTKVFVARFADDGFWWKSYVQDLYCVQRLCTEDNNSYMLNTYMGCCHSGIKKGRGYHVVQLGIDQKNLHLLILVLHCLVILTSSRWRPWFASLRHFVLLIGTDFHAFLGGNHQHFKTNR